MIPSLAGCFPGELAPYAALLRADEGGDALPGRALREAATVRALVERFAAAYPGAEPRAVASFWSQWYFGALVVPAVAAALRLDRALPVALDGVRLDLRENGTPAAFLLAHDGTGISAGEAVCDRLDALVEGHVAPLVAQLSALFGVPRRVLWTNAAAMIDWTMRQAEACGGCAPGPLAACRARLDARTDARGRPNPMCGAVRRRARAEGDTCRKVCCLRYRLPGVPSCGDFCPIDEDRRRADR